MAIACWEVHQSQDGWVEYLGLLCLPALPPKAAGVFLGDLNFWHYAHPYYDLVNMQAHAHWVALASLSCSMGCDKSGEVSVDSAS
eukprot:398252-Amphidinium_carterae.1